MNTPPTSPPPSTSQNGTTCLMHCPEGARVRLHFQARDLPASVLRSSNLFYGQVYLRGPERLSKSIEALRLSSRSNSSGAGGSFVPSAASDREKRWTSLGRTERRRKCHSQVEWSRAFDFKYLQGARMKVRLAVYDATPRLRGGDRLVAIADFRLDDIVGVVSRSDVDMRFVVEGGRYDGKEMMNTIGSGEEDKVKKKKKKSRKGSAGTASITAIPIDKPPTMYYFQIESDPIVKQRTVGKKKVKAALYTIRTKYDAGDGQGSLILLHQSDPSFLAEHGSKSVGSLSDNSFTSASVRSDGICHPTEKVEAPPARQSGRQKIEQFVRKNSERKKYIIFNWSSIPLFGDHRNQELRISFCASDRDKDGAYKTVAEASTTIEILRNLQVGESIPVTLFYSKKQKRTGRLKLKQIECGKDPKYFRLRFEAPANNE